MQLYDWGSSSANKAHYNQTTPPKLDLSQIKDIPVGMFVGREDDLGDPTDAQWARDTILINNSEVHYEEIEGGHASFMVGKDMNYFDNVMHLL